MIYLENICKSYMSSSKSAPVLSNLSLKLEDGEIVSIVGKSGCGKSTLLNIIGCIDGFDSGKYILGKQNIGDAAKKELAQLRCRRFGFVFQSFNLMPSYTVYENIVFPLRYSKTSKREYDKIASPLMQALDIEHLKKRMPSTLSGGEQQRVAIARSLVNNPQIILADEPTGNLDTQNGEEVMQLLLNMKKAFSKTLIIVTHDNKIASYADRIIEMRDGKIAASY